MSERNMTNELKINELIDLMTSYCTSVKSMKDVNPIMLWGSPGVGKSQAMKQVADKVSKVTGKAVNVTDVRLLLFSPVDLRGIPVADDKKELAIWLKPQIFNMNPSDDIINILILDEISAAPVSVQASAYQIVLDRQIGEHRIPDNCLIMCAGNKISDKSVAYKMPKALANRLSHLEVSCDIEDWKKWAIPKGVDSRIIGYLNFKNSKLFEFDANSDDNSFPTPRSWEKVNSVLQCMDIERAMPLVSGHIGNGNSYDFYTYTKLYNEIPSVEAILEGKKVEVPKKPDVNFALCSVLVKKSIDSDDKQLNNILKYANTMSQDFAVLLFKDMIKADGQLMMRLANSSEFDTFVKNNSFLVSECKNS